MTACEVTFRFDIEVENPARPGRRAPVLEGLGITPQKRARFRQASGTVVERWAGAALVSAAGTLTSDDLVFAEPGDLLILGARTLEELNLRVDPVTRTLVDAGPAPAAVTAPRAVATAA